MDSREALYQEKYSDGLPKGADVDRVVDVLRRAGATRFLDVGGGEGAFLLHAKEKLPDLSLSLVEVSHEAVVCAKEKGIDAHRVDAGNEVLPFGDASFDAVHCGDVIEHVFDTETLLDELIRVARPGAPVVLTTPNLAFWFNRLALMVGRQPFHTHLTSGEGGHIRVFTHSAMHRLLLAHGCRIADCWGYGINTEIGYGRRFRAVALLANALTNWRPSLASHMTFVIEGPVDR